jgi:hypothetical protein
VKVVTDKNDIFRYVVGNTLRHPIECCIDFEDRYEVFDFGIYDHFLKKTFEQNSSYKTFCSSVSSLKSSAPNLKGEEVQSLCENLSKSVLDVVID